MTGKEEDKNLNRVKYENSDINDTYSNVSWLMYYVVDLDGDGINELMVITSSPEMIEGNTIYFHVIEGVVYAYQSCYRAATSVHLDGSLWGSSGASDGQLYKVKFDKNQMKDKEIIAESRFLITSGDVEYTFKGEIFSEEEFFEFIKEYNKNELQPKLMK